MTGAQALPPGFVNSGVALDSSLIRAAGVAKTGTDFSVSIAGYTGQGYQRQRADDLTGTWTPIGPAQSSAGALLSFTDSGGATSAQRFYRITVAP